MEGLPGTAEGKQQELEAASPSCGTSMECDSSSVEAVNWGQVLEVATFLVKTNHFFRQEDEIYPLLAHLEIRSLEVPRREEREAVADAARGTGSAHSSYVCS
nr:uncharacterized protein LOC113817799 [Penaeus vannamei]